MPRPPSEPGNATDAVGRRVGDRTGPVPDRSKLRRGSSRRLVLVRMLALVVGMLVLVRVALRHRWRRRRVLHALVRVALLAAEQLVEEAHRDLLSLGARTVSVL